MKQFRLLTLLALLMTAATGAWATDGIACSASDIGKVLCTDGSIYATVGDATTAQKTAAAMIAYIDATNNKGLAIALADESGTKDYEAAGTACSGKAAVTGGTWCLPSDKDWQYMFIGCGSSESYSAPTFAMSKSYSGLASKLTTAQGAALQSDFYWSSTKDEPNGAWGVVFGGSNATFYMEDKTVDHKVRACLAFDVTSTYAITLAEGTEEFDKWAISPAEATKGSTITAKYSGERKVKSVKAVKKGGLPVINGKFSVSATKQVYFSKGNLRYVSGAWSFFDNQYDYYATYSTDAWDKFGWSNSTSNFGMSTSTSIDDFKGDLVDWGTVPGIGSGWFTLSNSEWGYLFNTRSASTVNSVADARYAKGKVNGVYGIILFPDTYTHPTGVTLPVGINEVGNVGWNGNNYGAADWTAMETAGCVFLPATGYRQGTSVLSAGESCSYRSSSRANTESVKYVYFTSSSLNANTTNYGFYGQCVRLVQDVK